MEPEIYDGIRHYLKSMDDIESCKNPGSMWMWKLLIFDGVLSFPIDYEFGFRQLERWRNSLNKRIQAQAYAILAGISFEGKYGAEQDYKLAFKYNCLADELDSAGTAYITGYCYLYGLGTDRNLEKAKQYIIKSANEGIEPAKQLKNKMGW